MYDLPEVTMPAGDAGSAVRMRSAQFRRLVDARAANFAIPVSLVAAGGVVRRRRPRSGAGKSP